ncbi:hydroxypyruvate isomerase, partial [Yersinia pestis PY-53]
MHSWCGFIGTIQIT